MPDRLPPVVRSEAGPGAEGVYDRFSDMADQMFGTPQDSPFILKRPSDGALMGPYPFFFAQPDAGEYFMGLFGKISQIPGLPADAREVVILAVGAKYQAAYELYAHTNVATKKVGIPQETAKAISRGEKPKELNENCSIAYDIATYLVATPGPLPQDLWDHGMEAFGKEGLLSCIHYTGAYAYTCIALNAMDAPVPENNQ